MKSIATFILFVLIIMSYRCFSQSDSLIKQELLFSYNDSVIHACTEAIKQNPDSATAYYKRGIAYYTEQNYTNVLVDFSKVIELNPEYIDAYFSIKPKSGWI